MRQILANFCFSVFTRYEKFVKTMSSNFSSSKETKKNLVKPIEVKSWRERTSLVNAVSNRIVAILVYRTKPRAWATS